MRMGNVCEKRGRGERFLSCFRIKNCLGRQSSPAHACVFSCRRRRHNGMHWEKALRQECGKVFSATPTKCLQVGSTRSLSHAASCFGRCWETGRRKFRFFPACPPHAAWKCREGAKAACERFCLMPACWGRHIKCPTE